MNEAPKSFAIEQERAEHRPSIETLLDRAFGPGRYARAAERLREGNRPVAALCLVAVEGTSLRASVQLWPILVGATPALLLGPLVVDPSHAGRGFGRGLMRAALDRAAERGHRLCLLVGDLPYYAKVGFVRVPRGRLVMPGPVDPDRLLVRKLVPGAFVDVSGAVAVPRQG